MTDPTPEERAREIACTAAVGDVTVTEAVALDEIRAAVEAENEACWQAVLALLSKELREYDSAVAGVDEYVMHLNRHAAFVDVIAAIRARGRTPSAPTQQQENDKP
jgi:hypothetical protein